MAITLGKDCSVSVGGNLVGVREVTIGYTAKIVDVNAYGTRNVESYNAGYDATATVVVIDDQAASTSITKIQNGGTVSISGGAAGFSFTGIITSVSESDPIDGVATITIEARQGRSGL